jgi:hypothetical protein
VIISWSIVLPKNRSLWDTVVSAYDREKNRKAVAASIALSQKQLDKMISGSEGRQLAVRRFEAFLDELDPEGLQMVMDYLDWKYRVPRDQKQENISGRVKDLMNEMRRILDLHEGAALK